MNILFQALELAWRECRSVVVVGFIVLAVLFAMTLPASLTGGHVGWVSLRLLTPELTVIAIGMALTLSFTLALMVLEVRQGQRASKGAATAGALMGLITPLLCCSPILPLSLGALALVFPAFAGVLSGRLQGAIATHETVILLAALALSIVALYQNGIKALQGACCRVS